MDRVLVKNTKKHKNKEQKTPTGSKREKSKSQGGAKAGRKLTFSKTKK